MTKQTKKVSRSSVNPRKLWRRGIMAIALMTPFLSTITFAQSKPKVVVTSTVLCDLTKQIAEDTIDLKCLINPDTDPHLYQPTPGDRIAIEAREANVKVSERELYADGLGEAGGEADTYQKMLIANTKTIVEGLGGKYSAPNLSASSSLGIDRVAVLSR